MGRKGKVFSWFFFVFEMLSNKKSAHIPCSLRLSCLYDCASLFFYVFSLLLSDLCWTFFRSLSHFLLFLLNSLFSTAFSPMMLATKGEREREREREKNFKSDVFTHFRVPLDCLSICSAYLQLLLLPSLFPLSPLPPPPHSSSHSFSRPPRQCLLDCTLRGFALCAWTSNSGPRLRHKN